jgi:WD40 repeat protein
MPKRTAAERHNEKVLEPERVAGLAVHPAGKWVATVSWGDNIHLWDFETGERLYTWERDQKSWMTGRVAFHPTADLLACGGGRGAVNVYDPRTKKAVVELETKADVVSDVAFSPDGKWLVGASGSDKTVHVWEVATWTRVKTLTGAKDAFYSLAFSPDGRTLASGSVDGNVYLWGVGTWERQATLPHGVKVYGLAYTPDGTRLACGCADNTVRLWDTTRHEQVAELRGHTDYVHQLAFSPDGRRLVTASGDLSLRTWDAAPVSRPAD